MIRLGFGAMLVGLAATAQAVQPDENYFASNSNFPIIRFANSGTNFLPTYQLTAGGVLVRSSDTTLARLGFGNTLQMFSIAKPQQKAIRDPNHIDGGISVPLHSQVESNFWRLNNISLPHHSISIGDERLMFTFHSHAALIEMEQVKIIFQPHLSAMLWGKAF